MHVWLNCKKKKKKTWRTDVYVKLLDMLTFIISGSDCYIFGTDGANVESDKLRQRLH